MRAGMLAADQLPVGSPLHHAVRAVANVHQIPLPARLLDAFDAATMEQARNTISSMVEPTDVEDEVALTAGQFTVMSALLGHELQAPLRKLSALSMEFGYYLSLAESGPLPVPAAELRQWSSDVALCQKQVEVLANQFISDKGRKGERAVDSVRRLVSRIGAGITFHDHTPPDARLRTTANRTTLSLVLNTLCSNAVAAAGGEPVSVTCSILPPAASDVGNTAGWFAIAIANGGAPMPDAVVQGINEGRWAGDPALGGVGAPLADINVRRAGGWMRWTPRGDGAGNLVTVAFPLSE
jgi:signal transduction histidine kinase